MVNSIVLLQTTQLEVAKIIKGLPNKTSSGHNQINNMLLKKLSDTISYPLTIIFNQSISQGIFPDTMKLAEVIPLHKGRETDQTVNYHLMSLLMTMSKVLEKIIYSRVYKFLDKNNILYESQYGFQNKRSCEQAICELLGHVLQAKESGDISAAMFLDLSKAFDTLNHSMLLKKLDRYGIRGTVNDRFKSYLHNRSLKTKVLTGENRLVYSDTFPITYGTAQGSCLGPLVFMIFCNDVNLLPTYGKLILFADNTTLINHHQNRNFLGYMMTHDMNLLSDWFKVNQLSLNIMKTNLVMFWQKGKHLKVEMDGI